MEFGEVVSFELIPSQLRCSVIPWISSVAESIVPFRNSAICLFSSRYFRQNSSHFLWCLGEGIRIFQPSPSHGRPQCAQRSVSMSCSRRNDLVHSTHTQVRLLMSPTRHDRSVSTKTVHRPLGGASGAASNRSGKTGPSPGKAASGAGAGGGTSGKSTGPLSAAAAAAG